jgi:hypothetical protein
MAESFRDFEHRGWEDPALCVRYDDYFARLTPQSIAPLLDAVRIGASDNVLDVATGQGMWLEQQRPGLPRSSVSISQPSSWS